MIVRGRRRSTNIKDVRGLQAGSRSLGFHTVGTTYTGRGGKFKYAPDVTNRIPRSAARKLRRALEKVR